ncbi:MULTISPECIES: plasmid mobilization protein [Cyanophyceae]|uniref:plasmid mobilization protein n=1 Tax=Cyanophyceae TaxID=3028117 RepID=UPI0016873F9F|nr:hypothetical protein [Trichocoleus sp. FACHB-69]MBD1932600.1 hypothetical protein [Trichocoleus sp. FACHB-69]
MKNSYIQPTLFDLEPYSVNPELDPIHLINKVTASLTVYLTPTEKAQLEENASRESMSVSEKVREVIQPWIQELN